MEVLVQLGVVLNQFQTQQSKEERKEESKTGHISVEHEKEFLTLLLARIQELERKKNELTQELKRQEPSKSRARALSLRPPSTAISLAILLYGIGTVSLIYSVFLESTVFTFIGLGLTFWGALLLFIRPQKYVRSDLLDSTALSSLKTVDHVMTELGYNQKGVYIPSSNPEKVVAFIPSEPLTNIPKPEEIEKQTFINNPRGVIIIPPGIELANLIESRLKLEKRSIENLKEQLPKLLIEDLEIFQDFYMQLDGNTVHIKFAESIYSDLCKKLQDTNICSSIGCPICSAMACILAKASGKPVIFEKDSRSPDGKTTDSWYRILEV